MLPKHFFEHFFRQMQTMNHLTARELERSFVRSMRHFEAKVPKAFKDMDKYYDASPAYLSLVDPGEKSSIFMKYEINDNGNVWMKTMRKEPGQEWKIDVEEFNSKDHQLKGEKQEALKEFEQTKSLENEKRSKQEMRINSKDHQLKGEKRGLKEPRNFTLESEEPSGQELNVNSKDPQWKGEKQEILKKPRSYSLENEEPAIQEKKFDTSSQEKVEKKEEPKEKKGSRASV